MDAGVVRLIVPDKIVDYIAPYLLEQTIFPIESDKDGFMRFDKKQIDKALSKLKVLAIGMGWGEGKDNGKILEYILENYELKVLIDADGLNTLAKLDKSILNKTKCKIVLTPHLKEFERLSGIPIDEIKKSPETYANEFAKKYGIVLLLKGNKTIVTDGEEGYIVDRGCPGMATAGSGDVLSGVLAGILGYNEVNVKNIAGGAYLAGISGELAQKDKNDVSMVASDTIKKIPEAINFIREK